jgi:hypothetical protein
MVWAKWSSRSASDSVAGLDINAGRARAAVGALGVPARPALLADPDEELPLALTLENRTVEVGPAALAHRRRAPHLFCAGFLPILGQPRVWTHARHKLDASFALAHVADSIRKSLDNVGAVYATLPGYLAASQVQLARSIMEAAKLPLAGSAILPLALVAARPENRRGTALVFDADDHAATWTLVTTDAKQVRRAGVTSLPNHGIRAWVDRLMDYVADRCIRLCRRDPRDSALAEQSLDEQLTAHLSQSRHNKPLALNVRTEHWYQNLALLPEEIEKACAGLARTVADGLRQCLVETTTPPDVLWVTASAARLPGVAGAVNVRLPERTAIEELSVHAPAEAAHALAVRRAKGELPAGHLDAAIPRMSVAAANDRLTVRKRD